MSALEPEFHGKEELAWSYRVFRLRCGLPEVYWTLRVHRKLIQEASLFHHSP